MCGFLGPGHDVRIGTFALGFLDTLSPAGIAGSVALAGRPRGAKDVVPFFAVELKAVDGARGRRRRRHLAAGPAMVAAMTGGRMRSLVMSTTAAAARRVAVHWVEAPRERFQDRLDDRLRLSRFFGRHCDELFLDIELLPTANNDPRKLCSLTINYLDMVRCVEGRCNRRAMSVHPPSSKNNDRLTDEPVGDEIGRREAYHCRGSPPRRRCVCDMC